MKIRRISEFQTRIHFPNYDAHYEKYREAFLMTDLGKIHSAIPWKGCVASLGLKEHFKGPKCIFSPTGKLALMFLKHYTGVSDRRLIEQLNGNIYYQMFCDLIIPPGYHIENYKIVSQIRCELAEKLNIDELEQVLMGSWKPYINNQDSITCDATCYESSIKYPTDVKLLYDSVVWIYDQISKLCKRHKLRMPRSKYKKWIRRSISYSKMRQKRKKKRISLTRGLLRLLSKLIKELDFIQLTHGVLKHNPKYYRRLNTIRQILKQQWDKFFKGIRPKQAIVSIDKPYIRPIVRGKEKKPVEFGAKVHKLQIDGIGFIEHISFEAFHEGNRLKKTIWKAQKLTGKKVKVLGADAIYATNNNRRYLTNRNIQTDFKPKGKPGKFKAHKSIMSKMITKERASRLEGSFGTDKEYFLLKKIKARTKQTEKLWIFIGIHTANALNIGNRMAESLAKAA
jgi:hypothetical protein